MQAHHFHHHLIGIGGSIERACARRMIAAHFARQQFIAGGLALCVELAGALLFLVGNACAHRSRGHEDRWQVPETQRPHEEPRNDLVADAQQRHAIVHRVAESDRRRERDRIAAEERELHAGLALSDTVAHGRGPAGHLHRRTDFACPDLHPLGIAIIGLMRRQHVVVGGHDAQIGPSRSADGFLILFRPGKGMGEVGARQGAAIDLPLALPIHQVEIVGPAVPGILDHALGNAMNSIVERFIRHASSPRPVLQERWQHSVPNCPPHRFLALCLCLPTIGGWHRSIPTAPRSRHAAQTRSGRPR